MPILGFSGVVNITGIPIKCTTTATDPYFDAPYQTTMTSYHLLCPPGCTPHVSGPLYGTDIYYHKSSVCHAALHAGAINMQGGMVEMQKWT